MSSRRGPSWKNGVYRILWIGLGFLAIEFLIVGLFASLGLTSRLLMVFTLGKHHVDQLNSEISYNPIIIFPITILVINNVILLLLSMGVTIHLIRMVRENIPLEPLFTFVGLGIVIWYFLSIIIAGIIPRYWPHYSIIIIPPICILAAWEIDQIHTRLTSQQKKIPTTIDPHYCDLIDCRIDLQRFN